MKMHQMTVVVDDEQSLIWEEWFSSGLMRDGRVIVTLGYEPVAVELHGRGIQYYVQKEDGGHVLIFTPERSYDPKRMTQTAYYDRRRRNMMSNELVHRHCGFDVQGCGLWATVYFEVGDPPSPDDEWRFQPGWREELARRQREQMHAIP